MSPRVLGAWMVHTLGRSVVRVVMTMALACLAFAATAAMASTASAASHGAPMCDSRAASAYADEPAAQPVDSGTIGSRSITPKASCRTPRAESSTIPEGQGDDLNRQPSALQEFAVLAEPTATPRRSAVGVLLQTPVVDGLRTGFGVPESPPPRAC